jgi:hypothetical protein
MKQSFHHHQGSLFTPTTTIVETSRTTNPPPPPNAHTEPLNIEITRDALAAEIIKDFVVQRRWEKELALGATDEELSRALGTCWASNQRLEIHCDVDPEPHLICSTTMGQELLRLDAAEIATLIRTHVQIPTVPNEEERQRRLSQHLDKERNKARNEIFTAVQNILEDKSRKRDQGFTQPFVDLLFTENCLQEENESATLEKITSLLIARQWTRLKAMKTAIQLVERAADTWRSIERYWLDRNF